MDAQKDLSTSYTSYVRSSASHRVRAFRRQKGGDTSSLRLLDALDKITNVRFLFIKLRLVNLNVLSH